MRHLNNTASIQESLKGPIEKSLLDWTHCKQVLYEVDGKIVTDWDA